MKVEKIDHIGILVKDVGKAEKFFDDLFEMKFVALGEIEEMDARSMIESSGVEIFEPLLPDGASATNSEELRRGVIASFTKGVKP